MLTNPLVTVIIPTYNRARQLCAAIESVLAQTYRHLEVIVVDDGSTDDTVEKTKSFGTDIRLFRQPNAGPGAARNRGIANARGSIITFLDSDDLWLPEKLERQVTLLERLGPSVSCCLTNASLKFVNGRETTSFEEGFLHPRIEEGLWRNPAEIFASRFVMFNQMVAIRRGALQKTGPFDSTLRYLEDYDMALRLSLQGPWCFIRDPLVLWRQGRDGLSEECRHRRVELLEYEARVLSRALSNISDSACSSEFRRHLHHRFARNRRELRTIRIRQNGGIGTSVITRTRELMERGYKGLFVRSPLFPRMVVAEG